MDEAVVSAADDDDVVMHQGENRAESRAMVTSRAERHGRG
jgi:hypothetical protein